MAKFIYKTGTNTGQAREINNKLVIGRTHGKKLNQPDFMALEDDLVSRNHLRVFNDRSHFFVEDLNSTNGSILRGITMQPGVVYQINDGDELRVGKTVMEFKQGYSGLHKLANTTPAMNSLDLDIDACHQHPHASTSLHVVSADDLQPDVSMMVDASQLLQEMRGHSKSALIHDKNELLKRMQAMIQVSIALGAITEQEQLLAKIIECVFDLFRGGERCFVVACNKSTDQFIPLIVRNRDGSKHDLDNIALSKTIISEVLECKHALLLMDAQGDKRFSHQDSVVDLAIRSVMCAPLLYEDEVLGLIQVDTRSSSNVFNSEDLEILTAISAQIAISMKNSQLYQDIENLFEGFVRASVQAIEARDPSTAGHSFRVADYTENLAIAVDHLQDRDLRDLSFSNDQLQEIRYAALLHDFGKVGVREHILTKAKKLYPHEMALLRQRFSYARACLERQAYRDLVQSHEQNNMHMDDFMEHKRMIEEELQREIAKLDSFLQTIIEVNEPSLPIEKAQQPLQSLMEFCIADHNDEELRLLNSFEFAVLTESRGSLNPTERREIESHVSHTFDFLSLIPWTGNFAGIPDIAHAHHEKLDGTGYPQGLTAEAIPVQSKIMAIADIFDALTAGDRPYRDGVSSDMALNIIDEQVGAGKLDKRLFQVFVESDSYKPSGRNS